MYTDKGDNIEIGEQIIHNHEISYPKICEVPSIKEYIENHCNISNELLNAYEIQIAPFIEKYPAPQARENDFVSYFREHLHPFDLNIYGAYPLMTHWIRLKDIIKIAFDKKKQAEYIDKSLAKDINYNPIDFSQYKKNKVLERLKEYAKGFKYGYENFISTFIDSPSAIMTNSEFKIQRFFDFRSNKSSESSSFQEIKITDDTAQAFRKWYEDGINAGYNYHSWYYLFLNHTFFAIEQTSYNTPKLPSIFNTSSKAFESCVALFEHLEITINGVSNLTPGRGGKLFGVIIAIKQTLGMLIADFTEQQLLEYFNAYLGSKYKVISKRGKNYDESLDAARSYLKKHFKKNIM